MLQKSLALKVLAMKGSAQNRPALDRRLLDPWARLGQDQARAAAVLLGDLHEVGGSGSAPYTSKPIERMRVSAFLLRATPGRIW